MAESRRSTGPDPGDLKGARILVVEARFYDDIADVLLAGCDEDGVRDVEPKPELIEEHGRAPSPGAEQGGEEMVPVERTLP